MELITIGKRLQVKMTAGEIRHYTDLGLAAFNSKLAAPLYKGRNRTYVGNMPISRNLFISLVVFSQPNVRSKHINRNGVGISSLAQDPLFRSDKSKISDYELFTFYYSPAKKEGIKGLL